MFFRRKKSAESQSAASVETPYGVFTSRSIDTLRHAAMREPFQLRLMARLFEKGVVAELADVGANLGLYGVYGATLPECKRVTCFEPSPDTFAELSKNLALNPRAAAIAKAHNVAVSDGPGEVSFHLMGALSPGNRISAEGDAGQQVRVEALSLDTVLETEGARDVFLKMDVEGHELTALSGASDFLSRRCAAAQIEILKHTKGGRAGVKTLMREAGFRFLFRCGADHIFIHTDHAKASPWMNDLFWSHVQSASAILGDLGKAGAAAFEDDKITRRMRNHFNGFIDVLR